MNDTKWQMIAVMVMAVSIFSAVIIGNISESNKQLGFANAGLEECSDLSWDGRKIWVKDCKSYIETYQKNKDLK